MRQFLFEYKKITKKKSIWLAVILSILAVIGISYIHFSVADSIRNGIITKQKNTLGQYQMFMEDAESELAAAEQNGDAETAESMKAVIASYKQSIANSEKKLNNYKNREWQALLKEDREDFELFLSGGMGMGIEEQQIRSFTVRAALEEIKWFQEKAVDPIVQNTTFHHFIPTIYEQFTGRALTAWEQLTTRYGDTGLTYFYGLMPNFIIPIIILIGCFLFGNGISGESGKKKRGLQLHFVQPVRRTTLFLSKYFSGLVATIVFVGVLISVIILSGVFGNGIGNIEYPVLVYEGAEPNPYGSEFNSLNPEDDQFHFIALGKYVKEVLVMGLGLVLFTYSLYFLLALAIRNQSITVLMTGAIIFGAMKAFPASAYNPFTYVDIHRVLNREIATLTFNPTIGFQNGIITLLVAGGAVILVAYICFRVRSRSVAS